MPLYSSNTAASSSPLRRAECVLSREGTACATKPRHAGQQKSDAPSTWARGRATLSLCARPDVGCSSRCSPSTTRCRRLTESETRCQLHAPFTPSSEPTYFLYHSSRSGDSPRRMSPCGNVESRSAVFYKVRAVRTTEQLFTRQCNTPRQHTRRHARARIRRVH